MNARLPAMLVVSLLFSLVSPVAFAAPATTQVADTATAGWPTFTSAQLHLSFAYPSGWGVDAPDWQPGPQAMGYMIGLLPPPTDPLAGHSIQISYKWSELPEGQSLRSWVETDYSKSRVAPAEITVLKAQTSDLPDGSSRQMLHTVVRSKGYAPQAIHLTQGRLVLVLATQADPAGLGDVLAQVAASVRFAPDAPQTLNALYGTNRVWPSVEESAKAYLESPYTPPACDSTCRDATAGAILALTPIRTVTQSPAFRATEEAYRARLSGHETRQAQLSAQPPAVPSRATETPRPPETATPNAALQTASAVAPTPAPGWQAYTTFGLTFACPADWQVSLPRAADWDNGPGIGLRAPAAAYPGGNVFSLSWRYHDIGEGQSLREWAQQVFLADRDTMIPPRAILALVDLPPVEPGGQALLTTELAGPGQGFYRQHVYLTHGSRVLDLTANTTPAESPAAAQILRAIAATMRFTAPPPAHDPAFGQPGLATVVAQATAFARAAATPSCDIVCRDATVMARVTPGPSVTYPPAMATQEKQYNDRVATATARALTTTPTPTASATPTATAQPGLVRYEGRYPYAGEAPLGTPAPSYVFQLAYAPTVWRFEGNERAAEFTYRASPSCRLEVQGIGEWGGPVVVDRSSLAGLDWSTAYWIADGAVVYVPQVPQPGPWFAVRAGAEAPTAVVEACRKAAEEVLSTFSMRP